MPTTIAGKYEVLERIGGGGQGTVFRVRHLFLEEIRALKVQADPGEDASDSVMRVLREGRALARLRHPHIVQVFDLGRDGNQHYLEMEYVDGPNLAQWLRTSGRPAMRDALTIGRQIAGALAYAHAQEYVDSSGAPRTGLIHRDVKPSNILLRHGTNAHALLADFGLVKIGDGSDRTQLGTMMGTYRDSAPEQLGFKRDGMRAPVDQRADLFSLGLVLYELIEGSPFHGTLGSEEVIARLLLDHDPLVPKFSRPIDPELAELVAAMVHRHRRYCP
jgi:serine/threonine-protein kinase